MNFMTFKVASPLEATIRYLVSPILIVLLNTNSIIVSPTLNVTQHWLSFLVIFLGNIDLQRYKYCRLLNDSPSKFQSFLTIFHHMLMTREGRVFAHG